MAVKEFHVDDHRAISAAVDRLRPHERLMVVDRDDGDSVIYEVYRVPGGLVYAYWDDSTINPVFVNDSTTD